jgi:hypothetical protein
VPGCACGCCGCGSSFRRFFSAKEERECLETYREQLKKELAGQRVQEVSGFAQAYEPEGEADSPSAT